MTRIRGRAGNSNDRSRILTVVDFGGVLLQAALVDPPLRRADVFSATESGEVQDKVDPVKQIERLAARRYFDDPRLAARGINTDHLLIETELQLFPGVT